MMLTESVVAESDATKSLVIVAATNTMVSTEIPAVFCLSPRDIVNAVAARPLAAAAPATSGSVTCSVWVRSTAADQENRRWR